MNGGTRAAGAGTAGPAANDWTLESAVRKQQRPVLAMSGRSVSCIEWLRRYQLDTGEKAEYEP